jgi:hypothetical protein
MGCVNTVLHSATIHRWEAGCPAGPRAPERIPPTALDAERAVLGSILLDNDVLLPVSKILPRGPASGSTTGPTT